MSVGGNIGGLLHAACSNGAATVTFTVPANTIKNSRTVTFEYLWNGTWTKIGSDCTQQPCYYVSSAAVTPRGDIPAVGGTYTVTLEGYGSFQIRAVDGNGVQLIISTEKMRAGIILQILISRRITSMLRASDYRVWVRRELDRGCTAKPSLLPGIYHPG